MQLDQNLLKASRKVCVTPSRSDSSRSRAQKDTSTARSESRQSLQQDSPQSSITLGQRGLKFSPPWPIDRTFFFFFYLNTPFHTLSARTGSCTATDSFLLLPHWGWGNLFGFCCHCVATESKDLKGRCCNCHTTAQLWSQTLAPVFSYTGDLL